MKADKKKIILNVYDEQIEVNVIKGEEDQYYDAARFVYRSIWRKIIEYLKS